MAVVWGVLVLCAGAALCIAARSYWNERKDYVRTRPTDISRQPERARVAGLREISFASPGDAWPGGVSSSGDIPHGAHMPRGGDVAHRDTAIAAWYAPPVNTRAAVVLVHGVYADRSALLFETRVLAQAGFAVLALDLPGQGASGGKTYWGNPERRAISAAVTWLSTRDEIDPQRVGAFGLSMGAYVLAQAAVLDQRINAVTLAASPNDVVEFNWLATRRFGWLSQWPTYWALRAAGTPLDMLPKNIVGEIAPRPLLILNGDEDRLVPEWMAHQLHAAAREPKEIYIVRGAHHADYAAVAPVEYAERLVDFYRRTLLA